MKRISLSVLALLVCGVSPVWAENSSVTGTIASLDQGKHQIGLNDGQTYTLQPDLKADNLKVGDRVTVSVEKQDGANVVNAIARP